MMNSKQKNQFIYQVAQDFLADMAPAYFQIEKYIPKQTVSSIKEVYTRMIQAAQNTNRMPSVIQFYGKNKEIIETILYDLDYQKIKNISPEVLFKEFCEKIQIKNTDSKQNLWLKWSKSVVDAAKFVADFSNIGEFEKFVHRFHDDPKKLPLLIGEKIHGMGFSSVCNALKEMGFTDYCDPSKHITDIFCGLGLSKNDKFLIFDAIVQMSRDCQEIDPQITPYKVDKIFWLIGSGVFYMEDKKVSGRTDEFIEYVKKEIKRSEFK